MHIAIVGGERVRIRLADDLKEERSHSVLSADLYHTCSEAAGQSVVEGFYTKLVDVFTLRNIEDTADGGKIKERYNGSGATVRGLNAEGRAAFTRWFELQAGNDVAAEPLLRTRAVERGCGGAARARMFRHARSLRLFHRVVQPLRRFTADVTGTCTGRCSCSTWPDRGGPGRGGHHAGVLRREPAAGL